MVHSFIHLKNKIVYDKCLNYRISRIFKDEHTYFYGDCELDVFIGTKNDYSCVQDVVRKVKEKGSGWIRNCRLEDEIVGTYGSLTNIINEFGNISESQMHKIFPKKETKEVKSSFIYRKDGNFTIIACETERFYYVFCFATS